jgi:hypothetical protein
MALRAEGSRLGKTERGTYHGRRARAKVGGGGLTLDDGARHGQSREEREEDSLGEHCCGSVREAIVFE